MATRAWFASELTSLGLGGLEDMFDYVESMSEADVKVYLESFIGTSSPEARDFLATYLSMRSSPRPAEQAGAPSFSDAAASSSARGKKSSKKRGRGGGSRGGGRGGRVGAAAAASGSSAVEEPSFSEAATPTPVVAPKQSARESAVERARGLVVEYRRSKKVVNCLACGFIERSLGKDGACSFCQAPMFPISEEDDEGGSATEVDAVAHKDKLLAFDKHSVKRTNVVDDGGDYVDADGDMWLSAEERAKEYANRADAEEKRNRRSFNVTLDVAGRKVVPDSENDVGSDVEELSKSVANTAIESDVSDDAIDDIFGGADGEAGGNFFNPTLSGPGPRFTLRDGEEGSKWLAAVTAGPAATAGPDDGRQKASSSKSG